MASIRRQRKPPFLEIVLVVLLIISIGVGYHYYRQYQNLKTDTSKTANEKNKELVAEINKVYELPKDEEPGLVAKVKDEEIFKKDYPVFVNAKVGDDLLLYEKAQLAILYRSSEKKVISTAQITFNKGSAVQIIAGAELQSSTEQLLLEKLPNDVRVSGKSTPVGQYTATTVVDLSGQKAELAKKIAEAVNGTVVTALPVGEKASDGVEIVVIVASAPALTPPAGQ